MGADHSELTSGKRFGARKGLRWIAVAMVLMPGSLANMVAQQRNPTPDGSSVAEITSALRARQFPEALKRSKDALAHVSRDPSLWTLEALSYEGLQQPVAAMRGFRRTLAIDPNYLPALQGAAQLSYANHSPGAEELLERLLQVQPEDQLAHAMLGELSFTKRDCPAAVANFSKSPDAIAQRPEVLMHYRGCTSRRRSDAGSGDCGVAR